MGRPTTSCTHLLALHPSLESRRARATCRPMRRRRVGVLVNMHGRVRRRPYAPGHPQHRRSVTLVTLTEVFSRLDDLQTACTDVTHSEYIVTCPRAAHRKWDGPRRPAHTCSLCTPVWKVVVHAPHVAPCNAIAWEYSCTSILKYGAVHMPPVIPSTVGAVALVTLTEVSSRLDDVRTAGKRCKHSGCLA